MIEENFLTDTHAITKEFQTQEDWCNYIHNFVSDNRCTYMEAVIEYCESNSIEMEHASKLIDENIKEQIRIEAEQENMMRPIGRLDFAS